MCVPRETRFARLIEAYHNASKFRPTFLIGHSHKCAVPSLCYYNYETILLYLQMSHSSSFRTTSSTDTIGVSPTFPAVQAPLPVPPRHFSLVFSAATHSLLSAYLPCYSVNPLPQNRQFPSPHSHHTFSYPFCPALPIISHLAF